MMNHKIKLEIDSCYSEYELISLRMKPVNGHKMDYKTYEKNGRIYFFEKVENNVLRLFCCTSKQSFYL